jgi:hypothetical protein
VDRETTEDLAQVLMRVHDAQANRFDLLDPGFAAKVKESARRALETAVERGRPSGKPFLHVLFYNRQPYYIANNFLEHLDVSEAILPFYNAGLLKLRFSHDYSCFNWALYERLLRTQFPQIADIPHNSKLPVTSGIAKVSGRSRRWAVRLLSVLAQPGRLSMVSRRKAIPRLLGVVAGRRDVEVVAVFLWRLWLLEKRLREANLEFDWERV